MMLIFHLGPLKINSGYRTPEHNAKVGGVPNSQHIHGKALDISTRGMCKKQKGKLYRLSNVLFDTVIIYRNHIHVHIK